MLHLILSPCQPLVTSRHAEEKSDNLTLSFSQQSINYAEQRPEAGPAVVPVLFES